MQFVAPEFILFLAAAFWVFHLLPLHFRKNYLLCVSYLFYSFWSLRCAVLLFGVTAVIYAAALRIGAVSSEKEKGRLAGAVVCFLLPILCFFKYLVPTAGFAYRLVPVGISYYTFKLISYVVDVSWKKIPAETDFSTLALYTAFFPQILSGPIQRGETFLPQIKNPVPVPYEMLSSGTRFLLFGFFKKLVIADRLGILVDGIFSNPSSFNSPALVLGVYAYLFQLYADFSGLTDIARGTAKLFGIESPRNFDLPFWVPNIQQYWRRWHMTLTQWLGDYVFNPLHMAFREWGKAGPALALFLNMVLIGIWHGPRMTFLVFGVLHGIFMTVSVLTLKQRDSFFKKHPLLSQARKIWAPAGMFQLVALAGIFFRAETLAQAGTVLQNIAVWNTAKAGITFFGQKEFLIVTAGILLMELLHYLESRRRVRKILVTHAAAFRWVVYYGMAGALLAFGQFSARSFIYFKF